MAERSEDRLAEKAAAEAGGAMVEGRGEEEEEEVEEEGTGVVEGAEA